LRKLVRRAPGFPPGPPTALIFDWDNTLVDTWLVIQDALNTTLTSFGQAPWPIEKIRGQVRKSLRDSFPDLFGDAWEEASNVFYRRYEEIYKTKLNPMNGAFEMLETFHRSGFKMGVVSNKRGDYLRSEAAYLRWTKYFDCIVGASDAARDKPASDPVHMVLSEIKVRSDKNVWFIGDADVDLECATRAGCSPILIGEIIVNDTRFAAFPPACQFSDCRALCNFVDNL